MSNELGEGIVNKININRINEKEIIQDAPSSDVEPQTLINHRRFDIMAKYIYGKFYEEKLNSNWGLRLYEDHIWVFNNYDEDDGSGKKGIESFVSSFNNTLKSVKEDGFDGNISLIPTDENNVPIDGAHRVAAALLYDKKLKTVNIRGNTTNYNYEFFKRKGLLEKWGDFITYEYCKLKSDTYVVLLFPKGLHKKENVREILQDYGDIYYEKNVTLKNEGPRNLLLQLFKEEFKDDNTEPDELASFYFNDGQETITVLVFETNELKNVSSVKSELTKLYSKCYYSFYINETHKGTLSLSQTLLNDNSIHFLNNALPSSEIGRKTSEFKKYLKEQGANTESFCIINSAVLEVYGYSKSTPLGFISYGNENVSDIEFHTRCNAKVMKAKKSIDDIIFNPENHFYYDGIKFATLKTLNEVLKRQGSARSEEDVNTINILKGYWISTLDCKLIWYNLKKKVKISKLKIVDIKIKFRALFEN